MKTIMLHVEKIIIAGGFSLMTETALRNILLQALNEVADFIATPFTVMIR